MAFKSTDTGGGPGWLGITTLNLSSFRRIALAWWMWGDSFSNHNDPYLCLLYASGSVAGAFEIIADTSSPAGNIRPKLYNTSSATDSYHFAPPSAAAWHHYIVEMSFGLAGGGPYAAYIDGVSQSLTMETNDSTNAFFLSTFFTWMAANGATAVSNFWSGRTEMLGLWGSASVYSGTPILNSSDRTAVMNGTPLSASVTPNFNWPLATDGTETIGSINFTQHGGAWVTGHSGGTNIFRNRYGSRGRAGTRVIANL